MGADQRSPPLLGLMKRRLIASAVIAVGAAALLVGGWYVIAVNPFEWGAESSQPFTWDKFNAVQRGESIEQVMKMLGDPIRPVATYESTSGNQYTRVCSEAGRCRQYQFAGARPLEGADDDADVIVTRHRTMAAGGVSSFNPRDVFEATAALGQPSGKVSIQYDESKKTDY